MKNAMLLLSLFGIVAGVSPLKSQIIKIQQDNNNNNGLYRRVAVHAYYRVPKGYSWSKIGKIFYGNELMSSELHKENIGVKGVYDDPNKLMTGSVVKLPFYILIKQQKPDTVYVNDMTSQMKDFLTYLTRELTNKTPEAKPTQKETAKKKKIKVSAFVKSNLGRKNKNWQFDTDAGIRAELDKYKLDLSIGTGINYPLAFQFSSDDYDISKFFEKNEIEKLEIFPYTRATFNNFRASQSNNPLERIKTDFSKSDVTVGAGSRIEGTIKNIEFYGQLGLRVEYDKDQKNINADWLFFGMSLKNGLKLNGIFDPRRKKILELKAGYDIGPMRFGIEVTRNSKGVMYPAVYAGHKFKL